MALDYALGRTQLDEIELHGVRSLKTGRFTITAVTIDGQLLMPTREFWDDLFKRYQLTSGWAEAKSYARRFEWLAAHHGHDQIPYRVLWDESGNAWVAPSRRRKIRRKKMVESASTTATRTTATLRCLPDSLGERCTETNFTEPTKSLSQDDGEWLARRRRRSASRHSKHGRPATQHSRLSNFFRGGRSN